MFEAWVEVEEPYPPQRHRILPRLKVVRSGQGRHRFKVTSRLDKVGTVPPPLSVKIRSRFWSHQIFGVSEERISATSAVCLVAGKFLWRLLNFRLPAPFLQLCWPQVGFPAPFLQRRQPGIGLSAPFLQRCKSQVRLFCCLSWRHVKVLRNGSPRRNFEVAARLSPAPILRPSLNSLIFSLLFYVVSFSMSLFKLFRCTLYCFFVLIKDEFISF